MVATHLTADQTVLSVGRDRDLLGLRHEVLRRAGIKVFSTVDESEAVLRMQEGGFQVLVLCHTIPQKLRGSLIESFREHSPGGKIIGVSDMPWRKPDNLDIVVYGVEGPEALIAAVRGSEAA